MAAEKYFPFRSVSGDRKYSAEDWAAYFALFLSDGVCYSSADRLKVVVNEGMKVKVMPGAGFIAGRMYMLETDKVITLDTADGALNRIDRIVLRCDYTNRRMGVEVVKGSYSENPTAPAITRGADVYELALADVYVAAGVISVTQSNISDQRLNTSLCGIVTGLIDQADTTEIFNQFNAYLAEFKQTSGEDFDAQINEWDAEFNAWFAEIKAALEGDIATELAARIVALEEGTKPAGKATNAENADDAKKLNGLTAEEFVNNGNLLVNGYFPDAVNSSGKTEWTGTTEETTVDGWKNTSASTVVTLTENGIKATGSAAALHWLYTKNNFTWTSDKVQTFTVSTKFRQSSTSFNCRLTVYGNSKSAYPPATTDWQVVTLTFDSSKITGISLTTDSGLTGGEWVEIEWIKLEPGSIATPLIPPNKELEKLKCGVADYVGAFPQTKARISSTFTVQDLLNLRTAVFFTNWDDNTNFPFRFATGVVIPSADTSVSTILYAQSNVNFATQKFAIGHAKQTDGVWSITWNNANDGGNADTVDGYGESKLLKSTGDNPTSFINNQMARITNNSSGLFPATYGQYTAFGSGGDGNTGKYMMHLFLDNNENLWIQFTENSNVITKDGWAKLGKDAKFANYLPLDGSVSMSNRLRIAAENDKAYVDIEETTSGRKFRARRNTSMSYLMDILDNDNYSTIILSPETVSEEKLLRLQTKVGGVSVTRSVLHTGNSNAIVFDTAAPSDTTALWAHL